MTSDARPGRESGVADARPTDASRWLQDHGDALYRYAKARVRRAEVAEDLVQETLLAALRSRDRFRGRSAERTWLVAILRHKIVDHLRRRVAEGSIAPKEGQADPIRDRAFRESGTWRVGVASWEDPAEGLVAAEFRAALDACVSRLPAWLAAPFVLRELEELPTEEIRRTLNLSPGNLRVRLHRARLLLRDCLDRSWFVRGEPPPGGTP